MKWRHTLFPSSTPNLELELSCLRLTPTDTRATMPWHRPCVPHRAWCTSDPLVSQSPNPFVGEKAIHRHGYPAYEHDEHAAERQWLASARQETPPRLRRCGRGAGSLGEYEGPRVCAHRRDARAHQLGPCAVGGAGDEPRRRQRGLPGQSDGLLPEPRRALRAADRRIHRHDSADADGERARFQSSRLDRREYSRLPAAFRSRSRG